MRVSHTCVDIMSSFDSFSGIRKPVEHFEIIANVLHKTKLKLMQMKQEQNQSYKELCVPFLNKLRYDACCLIYVELDDDFLVKYEQEYVAVNITKYWRGL